MLIWIPLLKLVLLSLIINLNILTGFFILLNYMNVMILMPLLVRLNLLLKTRKEMLTLDYQPIINQIGQIVGIVLPLGITIGLIERLVNWILRAATGKES